MSRAQAFPSVLAHSRQGRGESDYRMGTVMVGGGVIGALIGAVAVPGCCRRWVRIDGRHQHSLRCDAGVESAR